MLWDGSKSVPQYLKLRKLPMPFPDTERTAMRVRKVSHLQPAVTVLQHPILQIASCRL